LIPTKASGSSRLAMKNSCTKRSRSAASTPWWLRLRFSVILRREGFPLLAHTGELLNFPFSGLGSTLDKIGKNRAQVRKLLRGEIEALRFVRASPDGTTDVIRKRFKMDEKMARESYDVVVDAFSRDGRVPLEGVETLLGIEKAANQIPQNITAEMVVDNTLVDETLKELGR
jgi:ABC-type nitrate/sulfonate/bicarbonate transport system substrate-binding protein